MPTPHALPAVWVHTTLDAFNLPRPGGGYLSFLTPEQQARLERLRQARMLYDGRHREYFLDEGRTQFDFPPVRMAGGRVGPLYLTYNVLGLIALKNADLLFGEAPLLTAGDDAQQEALSRLVHRSALPRLFYAAALDGGYEGESFLEACAYQGQVYLRSVPADEIFPVGPLMPDGQYAAYVRYRVKNVGSDQRPIYLLLEVTYLAGRIERRCYQLDEEGRRREVALSAWFDVQSSMLDVRCSPVEGTEHRTSNTEHRTSNQQAVTHTGVARNTITRVPNGLVRGRPVSDFDGAIELQDALNAKNSQMGRVLLKHSDPRMAFPEELFDDEGGIKTDHDVVAFADPERVPQYITWDAELQHAMQDRAFILNQLLVRTETSPVLLGLKEGAAPDAYKKVRLESFNSLAKAQRKSAYWRDGVRRAVEVAQDLENAIPTGPRYPRGPVGVQLRDGIPADELETAQRLSILRAAGLISVERAVAEQLREPVAAREELARLAHNA
jgi:hypothetical protein